LPIFAWITPNNCNDTHWQSGCATGSSQRVQAGDSWMASMIPKLTALPSYRAGQTLIIIGWDEGDGEGTYGTYCPTATTEASCRVPTIVLSPYITPGTVDTTPQSIYSMLGTAEDILGYPRLGWAQGQPSMRSRLGF